MAIDVEDRVERIFEGACFYSIISKRYYAPLKSKCNDEGREDNVGKSSSFVSKFFSFRNLNSWLHIVKIYRGGYLNIHKSWQKGRDLAG